MKHYRAILSIFLMTVSSWAFAQESRVVLQENDQWSRLEYWKNIKPGSALDFSGMGLLDAPAGKYGWLKSVGGHFEFEGLPGVDQRFYGVNLCNSANYPSHAQTDELLKRLKMLGYNSIRIHHHDKGWADEANQEMLDYLLANAIAMGFYITTDLYVSRDVKWREIGVDRDGIIPKDTFKGLVGCDDQAFKNWCEFTDSFLGHVNQYNGRAYKDEPAICLISLVNENKISAAYRDGNFLKIEGFLAWWKEFCEEHPEFGEDPEKPTKIWSPAYKEFSRWYQRKAFRRCADHVRSLGCKALLSNDNNAWDAEGMGSSSGFDYIDSHFYVDHPRFPKKSWSLPSTLLNKNPVKARDPKLLYEEYAVDDDIPQVITEWSFSGPGRYRGSGGIIAASMASFMGWDGMWRFAYAHNNKAFADDPKFKDVATTYFDLARDPLAQATDRAAICLFLRRDADPGRVDGRHLSELGDLLQLDTLTGQCRLNTPRTCGFFAPYGNVAAGPLSAYVHNLPTTVWISSLDGNPIETSSRMLLVHLTDVQGNRTQYETNERNLLLRWGMGHIVENGSANICLKIAQPRKYSVWELDTTGARVRKLKTSVDEDELSFTVSTDNPMGMGRIYYEIVKK